MTILYRWFDAAGALLYVGISDSLASRTKAHARGSEWYPKAARSTLESFETREAAMAAEKKAIKTEGPQYNLACKPYTGPARCLISRREYMVQKLNWVTA